MLSAPFRLYFEIRKNLRQMNVPEITVGKLSSSFRLALLPFVLKDLVFRTSFESFYHSAIFFEYYSKLNKQRKLGIPVIDTFGSMMEFESQQGIHRRSGFFILGAAFAAVLTNPLDMITTRLIIQQKSAYSGMIDCAKTIIKEEGIGKLLISGFGARTGFLALHGSLMMALTPRVLPLVQQAYSIENLIN